MRDEMRDDAPDFVILRHGFHIARKDHLCVCGRLIPAGARIERTVGTEDGVFFTQVMCAGFDPNNPCPYPFPPDQFEPLIDTKATKAVP